MMHLRPTIFAAALLCALAMPAAGQDVADIPAPFAGLGFKAGMTYPKVRERLVKTGYLPARLDTDACTTAGGKSCELYPEIQACAGTGAGFCSARFERRGKVYAVVTAGPAGPLVRIFENEDQ